MQRGVADELSLCRRHLALKCPEGDEVARTAALPVREVATEVLLELAGEGVVAGNGGAGFQPAVFALGLIERGRFGCGLKARPPGFEGHRQRHDADEACGALLGGRVGELAEDAGVVEGVAFFAWLGVLAAVVVVVAADDAGPAVEGVDLEAGIVGQAGEAGLLRVAEGLDSGVLGEGPAGLAGFGSGCDVRKAEELDAGQAFTGEDLAELGHLVGVGGGDHDGGEVGAAAGHAALLPYDMGEQDRSRQPIATAAADCLEQVDRVGGFLPALIGFDGFIDAITEAVDTRADMSPGGYTPIRTITQFAARAAAAAGKSTNIELVVTEERFGGNGPLMAGAMGRLQVPVTYVGGVGDRGGGG